MLYLPWWTSPSNCEPKQTFLKLLLDNICHSVTKSNSHSESSRHLPRESKATLCHSHRPMRGVASEREAEVFPFRGSSSSHASRHDVLFLPPSFTPPSLHASVFNGCCQKGYQANMFSVFGNGSYELRLLPDSILVWAWLENVCCGHLSRIDWVEHRDSPRLRQGGNHISWKKNGSEQNMGADTHKLNC